MGPPETDDHAVIYLAGIVESSFAVRLISSIEMYGVTQDGIIQAVCFANNRTNNVPQPDIRNLVRFTAAHDLVLVDWCRATAAPPVEEDYAAYFNQANPENNNR